jgi:nickel transport protein
VSSPKNRSHRFGMVLEVFAIATIVLCFATDSAQAHKVNVFAYLEGDRVVVEGYFGGNVKARDCTVEVLDETGKKIHEGKTDEKGIYSFRLAELPAFAGDLRIVLEAGMGHKAEYTLSASDIPGSAAKDQPPKEQSRETAAEEPQSHRIAVPSQPVDDAALRSALESALDKKLEPIVRMLGQQEKLLLEQKYGGPKLSDIVGGFGWILGLVGIATFLWGRNRSGKN